MSINLYTTLIIVIPIITFIVILVLLNIISKEFELALLIGFFAALLVEFVMIFTFEDNVKPVSTQLQVMSCLATNNELVVKTEDGKENTYNINKITFTETDDEKTYILVEEYGSVAKKITIKASKDNIVKIKGYRKIDLME